ncbi:hypothetical protein NLI96_g6238 [Meripilus lineatus]|uniref:Helitron helicase-like domain-containing protein n=1 Tax=Meripilus lineatus TaxID=2056292 RepID=A0AAD5YI92_9APHY|nr:hypothetical protein NLI96_g6238 [Physisporinus lineatus]
MDNTSASFVLQPTTTARSLNGNTEHHAIGLTPEVRRRSADFGVAEIKAAMQVLNMFEPVSGTLDGLMDQDKLVFLRFATDKQPLVENEVVIALPLSFLVNKLPSSHLKKLCALHKLHKRSSNVENMVNGFKQHTCCSSCSFPNAVLLRTRVSRLNPFNLAVYDPEILKSRPPYEMDPGATLPPLKPTKRSLPRVTQGVGAEAADILPSPPLAQFPPTPPSSRKMIDMIREWTNAISFDGLEEDACGCCARLSLVNECKLVNRTHKIFDLLISTDKLPTGIPDGQPLLCPKGCVSIGGEAKVRVCKDCFASLRRKRVPPRALVNGTWIGDVPPELSRLNFSEKILVAKNRHNTSVVRVAVSGHKKMTANAIVFPQPVAEFAALLPPSKKELNQCLIVLFTGPKPPTAADYKRTPLLVRPDYVLAALEWLIANHKDYKDVTISHENLRQYQLDPDKPPVRVETRRTLGDANVDQQNMPTTGGESEIGSEDGPCPLAVAGLVAESLNELSREQKVTIALDHFEKGSPFLLYGRSADPAAIYSNPQLYATMFPWLFPLGYGTFKNELIKRHLPRRTHIKSLLMYHDLRFQEDEYFIFLVFNQMQILAAQRGGGLLVHRKNFPRMVHTILNLDRKHLSSMVEKSKLGPPIPENDGEKAIKELITGLDHIAGHVAGSNAKRKYQHNEIRSLTFELGAPSFFITFAPADTKSPLCLYLTHKRMDLSPLCPDSEVYRDRAAIVANNPVAAARFFNHVVNLFLKVILKTDSNDEGLFGKTIGYYGTVESQGRLTLHLHLLLWIENADSPEDMRQKILSKDEEFKNGLLTWLEGTHRGDFCTGTKAAISARLEEKRGKLPPHKEGCDRSSVGCVACILGDPTLSLPEQVPDFKDDVEAEQWMQHVLEVTNEILFRCNLHDEGHHWCRRPDGSCKGRFPRPKFETSSFNEDGILTLKKCEEYLNTFSIVITYLFRCNTDVTSLSSGTQVKAVIAYVTDYITKSSLKSHAIFVGRCGFRRRQRF